MKLKKKWNSFSGKCICYNSLCVNMLFESAFAFVFLIFRCGKEEFYSRHILWTMS